MKNKLLIFCIGVLSIILLCNCNNEKITCKIISPENGAEFWKTQDIPVSVEATINKGSLIQVQIFLDDMVIGTLTEPPYDFTIKTNNVSARVHGITAVAYSSSNQEVDAILIKTNE